MIYFNNAADSYPKPLAIQEVTNGLPYMEINRICNCNKESDIPSLLREKLRKFLNLPINYQVTLTNSSTEAANLVIRSFYDDRKAKHFVGYDKHSHNCIIRPLLELYGGISAVNYDYCQSYSQHGTLLIEDDELQNLQFFSFPMMSNVSGKIIDPKFILNDFKCRNIKIPLLIDISQAIGNTDIDIASWCYHNLYVFGTFHKAMMSIPGCGFLIHPEDNNLKPLIYGGTGTSTDNFRQPREYPFYLESGTKNMLAISAAIKSIDITDGFIKENSKIKDELVIYFIEQYKKYEDDLCRKYFDLPDEFYPQSGIINILCDNIALGESITIDLAEKYKIITRFGTHCSPHFNYFSRKFSKHINGTIRLSFSPYNTKSEIDCFLESFHSLLLEKEIQISKK